MNRAEFGAWLDGYRRAWEEGDPSKVLTLFAPDAIYEETPFVTPMRGHAALRRYWEEGARDAQRDVAFTYEIYAAEGDIGLCRWHCRFERVSSGERIELDGIFRCVFDPNGKCRHFQEWWHRRTV